MGLGRAEQNCSLCLHTPNCLYSTVHMSSCFYSSVQLPGASLASVEVALTFVVMSDGRRHTNIQVTQMFEDIWLDLSIFICSFRSVTHYYFTITFFLFCLISKNANFVNDRNCKFNRISNF